MRKSTAPVERAPTLSPRAPGMPCGGGNATPVDPAELARQGDGGRAAAELRAYLRRGLHKALAGQRLCEEDIEDFTHDAIVRILDKLQTFRGDSRFTTWAMAVAIRVAFGALRRRAYQQRLQEVELTSLESVLGQASPPDDPTRPLERRALLEALQGAVRDELTERQRAAVLGELQGVPSDELAERLGMKRNALYKLHHDARRKLREAILAAGFTEDEVRSELREASEES